MSKRKRRTTPAPLPLFYSGQSSQSFWKRLNAINDTLPNDTLYLLGCTLQDLEGRVRQLIMEAESDPPEEP